MLPKPKVAAAGRVVGWLSACKFMGGSCMLSVEDVIGQSHLGAYCALSTLKRDPARQGTRRINKPQTTLKYLGTTTCLTRR